MGGSTSFTDGCTIPGVSLSGSQITSINWGNQGLSKTISPILGRFTFLIHLYLHQNQLTGPIPIELANLKNLKALVLHTNQLSGLAPKELGTLTHLKTLSLSNNQLSGTLPKELGNLRNLTVLQLSVNQFSGSIPIELVSLSKLTHLLLFGNRFNGSLPLDLNKVEYLSVQYNPNIDVSNIGSFKSSSFDSVQIKRYFSSSTFKRGILPLSQIRKTLCKLDDAFENQEIMNQCIAGIIQHCSDAKNFSTCKTLYDDTLKESVYKDMQVCAPWNSGWRSADCADTTKRVKSRFNSPEISYKQVFVDFIKNDLFSSRQYAPCFTSTQKCNY